MKINELEEELSKLTVPEKKRLLRQLISELDESRDGDVEPVWPEDVQRRYRELKDGTVKTVPAGESIADARERLKNVSRAPS